MEYNGIINCFCLQRNVASMKFEGIPKKPHIDFTVVLKFYINQINGIIPME